MRRGEVWWVNFDPSIGAEIQKKRPAVIVSNDSSNEHLERLQVVPLTTKIDRLYPGEAYVMLKGQKRKATANQLTTVSKLRVDNQVGRISDDDMRLVEEAIRVQLGLKR